MAAYNIVILVSTYLFCTVHSQFLPPVTRDYGFECGPLTSSVTVIDNSMPLSLANALQSMILSNFLDSSISLSPKCDLPCSFVIESVTYSPIIDPFYPCDTPVYDIYPVLQSDFSPVYHSEIPQVVYTETVTFGPSPIMSDVFFTDIMAPKQIVPVSCVNSFDVVPISSLPPIGLMDLIMPPALGYNDVYTSGVPFYFDNL